MSGSRDLRHYEGVEREGNVTSAFVRDDDPRAFEAFYDRYAPAIARFAWSVSPGLDAAQELVQETFLTAWRRSRG